MKLIKALFVIGLSLSLVSVVGMAKSFADGLTIYAAESGIGKFHRFDNQQHAYAADNAWSPFILSDSSKGSGSSVVNNADGSVSIFFDSLQALFELSAKVATDRGQKIAIFNMNAHGMPGGMWYPKDSAERMSGGCSDWREAAEAQDQENYDQYYSPISLQDIMTMRALSERPNNFECVAGLSDWQEISNRVPAFKAALADNVQIHFLSCIVGLGSVGDTFTKGVATLLLSSSEGRVESSLMYGLGDWSMPTGMGFWDYQNEKQLAHDNEIYPVDRMDSEMAQKGHIRVAKMDGKSTQASSSLISDVDFMYLGVDTRDGVKMTEYVPSWALTVKIPEAVRLPGTKFIIRQK